jgi:hypothetical protein
MPPWSRRSARSHVPSTAKHSCSARGCCNALLGAYRTDDGAPRAYGRSASATRILFDVRPMSGLRCVSAIAFHIDGAVLCLCLSSLATRAVGAWRSAQQPDMHLSGKSEPSRRHGSPQGRDRSDEVARLVLLPIKRSWAWLPGRATPARGAIGQGGLWKVKKVERRQGG